MLQQLQQFSQATSKLQVTEIESSFDGYYSNDPEKATNEALGIITDNNQNPAFRQLSATFLYSFIDRRWRVSVDSANQNTRGMQQNIKSMLLRATMENAIQDKQTLRKFAMVVARVCRFDFPALWSGGPFEPILTYLTENNGQRNVSSWLRHQMFFVMHLSLKELVSNRVPRAQQTISDAASRVLNFAGPLCGQGVDALLSLNAQNEWKDNEILFLEVKTLSKIVLRCAATINLDVAAVKASLDSAVKFATVTPSTEDSICLAERFSKIVCWAVEKHGSKLPDEQTFVQIGQFFVRGMQQRFSEKMHARGANSLKCLLDLSEGDSRTSQRIRGALQSQVLTRQTVESLIRDLVERFFRDTAADLEEWDADPENFVIDSDESNDEESAFHASEQFFLSLMSANWEGIVDLVWGILTDALNSNDPSFIAAALHAIGLGYAVLGTPDQFVSFLRDKLMPALKDTQNTNALVHRRVVWVIGMWCDSLTDQEVRRRVFEAFAELLDKRPHPVISLTCLRAVSHLCSDSSFTAQDVAGSPLVTILNAVKSLLQNTKSPETTKSLVGLIFLSSASVVAQMPEAAEPIKQIGAYKTVIDCLEKYVRDADQNQDSDNLQCAAAIIILQTLTSAFEHNLIDEAETRKSLQLAIQCVDLNQPIRVWTEDEGWELIATFMSRGAPPDIARVVIDAVATSISRDFPSRHDVVKTLAYLSVFSEDNSLFSPAMGDTALEIICETKTDDGYGSDLKHKSLLLLEGIIRRFPDQNWAEKAQRVFVQLGNADVCYDTLLDAIACTICFERQTPPIAADHCARVIEKIIELTDYMPNSYAALLLLQGVNNLMNLVKNTPFEKDCADFVAGLDESAKTVTPDDVESHWSSNAVQFLLNERLKRMQ